MNDPALQAMREPYLVPNNVRSLLDAAFMLNGRAYGMVCCEETVAAARLARRRRAGAARHRHPIGAADVGRTRVGAVDHAVAAGEGAGGRSAARFVGRPTGGCQEGLSRRDLAAPSRGGASRTGREVLGPPSTPRPRAIGGY